MRGTLLFIFRVSWCVALKDLFNLQGSESRNCSLKSWFWEALGSGTLLRSPSKQTESSSLISLRPSTPLLCLLVSLLWGKNHTSVDLLWFMSHSSRKWEFASCFKEGVVEFQARWEINDEAPWEVVYFTLLNPQDFLTSIFKNAKRQHCEPQW